MTNEWTDFAEQPGTHLRWARTGVLRRELCTAEQTMASICYALTTTVSTSGRAFTWRRVTEAPGRRVAEIVRPSHGENDGRAAWRPMNLRELLDDTGSPVLYASGVNYAHAAGARITFPDRRWLRFPVQGTRAAYAVMTAVDQDGNEAARYQVIGPGVFTWPVEIIVPPGKQLTDELALTIVISAPWLMSYFARGTEGGGG